MRVKKRSNRGSIINTDTGWDIQVSSKVFSETKTHKASATRAALPYLEYIDSIVENAVLLDTFSMDEPNSENSLFMHSFYAVADIGNGPELLKLYIEKMNNPISSKTSKRAYKLLNIENASVASARVQNYPSSVTNTTNAIHTVSDLFKVVKSKDSNFKPNPVNPTFLNKDGTPKKVYHGTGEKFTEFDITKSRSYDEILDYDLPGFYFSESKEESMSYGGDVGEFYIRINNPYEGIVYNLAKEKGSYRKA